VSSGLRGDLTAFAAVRNLPLGDFIGRTLPPRSNDNDPAWAPLTRFRAEWPASTILAERPR